ncbi:MAG: DUF5103 domain-containing protein [Bacteroidales bacterium]|nr:DUF5103 domain-containing protein [Bacteroidales bacterium]
MMKKIFFTMSLVGLSIVSFGQIFHSVKCTPESDVLGYPMMRLNSHDQLHVSFDEISVDARSLEYRFVLCNADWTTARLQPIQYMSGVNRKAIDDIRFSLNTRVDYTHYQFAFPDEHTKFLVSGNYKCEIYDVDEPEETLLIIHFFVTEDAVNIAAKVIPPKRPEFRRSKQQLEFDITARAFDIMQPYQNLTVLVQQNGRTDQVRRIQPQYIVGKTLKFADSEGLLFDGGNEFRNFDTKFLNFNGLGVERISTQNHHYFVQLHPAESRATRSFADNGDINGRYVIRADMRQKPETEAEYTVVEFSLYTHFQGEGASVHVFGELTNWTFGEISEMEYDFARKCYSKLLFLKQGFYDYEYVLFNKRNETVDITHFEGNQYLTKNNYTIYVYYRGNSDHHDRLIGVSEVKAHE